MYGVSSIVFSRRLITEHLRARLSGDQFSSTGIGDARVGNLAASIRVSQKVPPAGPALGPGSASFTSSRPARPGMLATLRPGDLDAIMLSADVEQLGALGRIRLIVASSVAPSSLPWRTTSAWSGVGGRLALELRGAARRAVGRADHGRRIGRRRQHHHRRNCGQGRRRPRRSKAGGKSPGSVSKR